MLMFRLIQLSEAKEEFHEKIEKPMLGLMDLLLKYKSIRVPFDAFIQIASTIKVSIVIYS